MQQLLPFTVLKLTRNFAITYFYQVATALTVYGIETSYGYLCLLNKVNGVATALTVYGIETEFGLLGNGSKIYFVATALTVYGIETFFAFCSEYK